MASETNAECLLNTTECLLQTVASMLNEIQEQTSEYSWDPLAFIFTATIGVIAIAFAALTAFQAFLTAGPGRTKSGAYATGPWSWHNYRKFDRSEMRFRTISSTPGLGRLTLDRESGLPRVRGIFFNLVFRQHQLLGAIGFFEIYGKVDSEKSVSPMEIRRRFFQAHGQFNLPGVTIDEDGDNRLIERGRLLTFNECGGSLHLLMAHIPDEDFLPIIFPSRKAKLHERLDNLLLQSRSWGLQSLSPCDIFPYSLANVADSGTDMTKIVNSWAKSTIDPDIKELDLDNGVYHWSLKFLKENPSQDSAYNSGSKLERRIFFRERAAIDLWLDQMEPHVLCRKLTLSIIGEGIQQIVDSVQQQPFSKAESLAEKATELSNRSELERKLV
ncbi:hypothetical protein F25303_1259 [Fusarium sp. NRRL 25303]|nr:hypothetical protein F25303_1259 [Fusarium sp. NRRL 25303]